MPLRDWNAGKLKKQKSVVATAIPAISAISDKSNVVNIAKARLIRASAGLNISIDELMSWYENDYQFISEMKTVNQLRWCVQDYIKLREKRCKK